MKHLTRTLLPLAIAVCALVGAHDTAHAEARGKGHESRFDKDGNGVPDMTDRMARWQERKEAQEARRSPAAE
jgi:hypothetical protein